MAALPGLPENAMHQRRPAVSFEPFNVRIAHGSAEFVRTEVHAFLQASAFVVMDPHLRVHSLDRGLGHTNSSQGATGACPYSCSPWTCDSNREKKPRRLMTLRIVRQRPHGKCEITLER